MFLSSFGVHALELALQNYLELVSFLKQETTFAAAEKEINTFRAIQDKLSTELEVEMAKVRYLGDKISTEKASSFQGGFNEGRNSSPEF